MLPRVPDTPTEVLTTDLHFAWPVWRVWWWLSVLRDHLLCKQVHPDISSSRVCGHFYIALHLMIMIIHNKITF